MWAKFEKPCTIWKVVLLSSPVLISSAKMTLLGLHSDEAADDFNAGQCISSGLSQCAVHLVLVIGRLFGPG
jgi:hypothetical protein